ncbi:MAG TPA: KH domain-containing protein [Candidatus Limnocylindria bacterium]|nr:KH domain-containing protein [Candidatus Limnocylindria bacterium]
MVKELIEYIVKSLVDQPDAVAINLTQEGSRNTVKIKVSELDLGRIIGKDGQTIRAIRALVTSVLPAGQEIAIDVTK